MTCTKAQVLILVDHILGLIKDSSDVGEAYRKVLAVRARLAEMAVDSLLQELGL